VFSLLLAACAARRAANEAGRNPRKDGDAAAREDFSAPIPPKFRFQQDEKRSFELQLPGTPLDECLSLYCRGDHGT
jgi:hypothetical protein